MADFSALKTSIQNYIKQNGNEEITGNLLQQILLSMVTTLGDSAINDLVTALNAEIANRGNADTTLQGNINSEAAARGNADTELGGRITTLQGVVNGIVANVENGYVYAGIATPSTTPVSGKVFYLALTAGTYANFGATVVPQGINILKYNGSAWSLDSFLGLDDAPTQGSNNLVKSGGVLDSIIKDGSAFDLSAYNNGTTYADLSAALTALNTLPAAYKKGGMSMKYVQSSDNKYVQFRCKTESFSANPNDWYFEDNNTLVDNPEWIMVETDAENKILGGRKPDGTAVENVGMEATKIKSDVVEVNDHIELSEKAKQELSNVLGLNPTSDIIELNNVTQTEKVLSDSKRQSRLAYFTQKTPFNLLYASDIHGDQTALERIVEYKSHYAQYLDDAIITGDIVASQYSDGISFYTNTPGASSILLAIGNHDTYKAGDSWNYYVGEASYNQYIKDFAQGWGITPVVNKCYYYKDYNAYNIRLIVTDCAELASESQLEWFGNLLADAKTNGMTVIAVNHFPTLGYYSSSPTPSFTPYYDAFECSFNSRQPYTLSERIAPELLALVEQYKGEGLDFACWITGHAHSDYVGVIKDTSQLIITIDTASLAQSNWSDTERVEGKRSQDLFNILSVDTYQKVVRVFRVGANMDSWLRSKNTMCIQYASNVLYTLVDDKPILIHCE